MPRDVLTLDVEINPTQIAQQTDLAREMIAQNLSVGGSQFGSSPVMGVGGPIMGGPYGGMSPYVPAFAPESAPYAAFQSFFPGAFAPPGISPEMYGSALTNNLENRASQFGVETLGSGLQFAAEMAGGGLGAGALGALGYKYGGAPGAILGGLAGFGIGGGIAGEIADLAISPAVQGAQGLTSVTSAFEQYGFRAGMGSFLQDRGDEDGSQSGREIAQALAKRSIDYVRGDNEVQSLGLNAQEITKKLLVKGFQNNIFGVQPEEFGQGDDQGLQDLFIEDKFKPEFRRMQDIAKAFNTSYDEALDIRGDLRRLGAVDDSDIEGQIGILGSSMREFGLPAKELFRSAAVQGSAIGRSAGLSGAFGMQQNEINTFRLAEAEKAGFLDTETKLAGGGLPNIASRFSAVEDQQLGKGGYLRDLIMASSTEEGGLDSARLKELVGRGLSPLQAREEANKNLFSGGDAIKRQEDFNFNFRDLADQARKEVPGFEQAGLSKEVMNLAQQMASMTGREVTPATLSAAAQRLGMDENTARAFVGSQGNFPKSADVFGLMDGTQKQFEAADKAREDDPFARIVRGARGKANALQELGEDAQMGFTTGIEGLRQRFRKAMGKKEDGSDPSEEEKNKALKEFEGGTDSLVRKLAGDVRDKKSKEASATKSTDSGSVAELGSGLLDTVKQLTARVADILNVIQVSQGWMANDGGNTKTSAPYSEKGGKDPATGN